MRQQPTDKRTQIAPAKRPATWRRDAVEPAPREICPFCQQPTTRVEISSSAGTRAFSLCCDMPTEFIDNYEVYEALPEPLQQIAIDKVRADYAAMAERDKANAEAFAASLANWYAKHAHLSKP